MDSETRDLDAIDAEPRLLQNTDQSHNIIDLPLEYFRDFLIRHFNVAFKQNKIIWLTRN